MMKAPKRCQSPRRDVYPSSCCKFTDPASSPPEDKSAVFSDGDIAYSSAFPHHLLRYGKKTEAGEEETRVET